VGEATPVSSPSPRSRPGGGRSTDRATWRPSRATVFVPVTALSPLYCARFKAARRHAGRLEQIDPQGWTLPWHGHRQAHHHGHAAVTSLAPSVCKVALSKRRIVGLQDRPVPFPSRHVGRTRPRTPPLDILECLRRCLQHVLPDGVQKVRPCGLLHARGAVPLATSRLMMGQGPCSDALAPQRQPPPRPAVRPGAPRCVSSCAWGSQTATVSIPAARQDVARDRRARRCGTPTAPGRPPPALKQPPPDGGSVTAFQRLADASRGSTDAPMAMPHDGVRHMLPALS
jgi:putative transposase